MRETFQNQRLEVSCVYLSQEIVLFKRLIHEAGSSVNLVRGRHFGVLAAFTTDFTELVYANGAHKALLISLLDLRSRWIGGWAVGANANHELALQAIDRLYAQLNELGRDLKGVIIHHDRDPVFTGHASARSICDPR